MPAHTPAHLLLVTAAVVALLLLSLLHWSDPGFLAPPEAFPAESKRGVALLSYREIVQQRPQAGHMRSSTVTLPLPTLVSCDPRWGFKLCSVCRAARPLRSKHCRHCGRCVRVMDHHSPLISNCVGARNHRAYILLLLLLAAVAAIGAWLLGGYLDAYPPPRAATFGIRWHRLGECSSAAVKRRSSDGALPPSPPQGGTLRTR
jgi:hypothetical protein